MVSKFKEQAIDAENKKMADLFRKCSGIISDAEADGLEIGDGDVVDLIADNCDASLNDIRGALLYGGLGERFPKAVSRFDPTK